MISDKRIGIYIYSPRKDIGHIIYIIEIIKILKKTGINVYLIHNSQFNTFNKEISDIADACLFINNLNNSESIISFIKNNKINIFITEFFPFGRLNARKELIPVLKFSKDEKIKIISMLPMPYFTHNVNHINQLEGDLSFYNKIIITTPARDIRYFANTIHIEKRITKNDFLRLFIKIKDKIFFTGYLVNDIKTYDEEKNMILVCNGGGSVLNKIITSSIRVKKSLNDDIKMLIVCGINSSSKQIKKWNKLILKSGLKKIKIIKHTEKKIFLQNLSRASVVISSGGSTVYEILKLSKKAIIIPYEGKKGHEHSDQLARAVMLGDLINASVIRERELTPECLRKEIIKKLEENKRYYFNDKDFSGRNNLINFFKYYE
ncbi:MAG: hypothetical protein KA059_03100 [Elusimicrobiales bacterium]|nr:hypothetical protein [Elusimicrobiales bacterium]